jgi:hypothetical protein
MDTQWNLFVSVLIAVLEGKEADLDKMRYHADIHPQKIQRLKESLKYQGQFPVLNDDELQRVVSAFTLDDAEERQVRAAILATGIEAKLIHRIGAKAALKAATTLLPIICKALEDAEGDEDDPLSQIRQGGTMDMTPLMQQFAEALALIDSGTLNLYLANATDPNERQASLRQAREDFTQALTILDDRSNETICQDETWLAWQAEAQAGLRQAQW